MVMRLNWRRLAAAGSLALAVAGSPYVGLSMVVPAMAQVSPSSPAVNPPSGLEMAPNDAAAILFVPNLSKFSQRLANLNDALRLDLDQLSDPLLGFKQALNISKGFNDDGPALIVVTGGAEGAPASEQNTLVLLPVSDYGAFVSTFSGDPNSPVASISTLEGNTGFVRKLGSFALIGQKKEAIENYRPSNAAGALQATAGKYGMQIINGSDMSLYLNVAAMSTKVKSTVEAARLGAEAMASQGKPSARDSSKVVGTMLQAGIDAIARDASSMVLGFDLGEGGVGVTMSLQFKPGTPLATRFGNGAEAGPLLNRLPGDPYLMASAINLQGIGIGPWAKDVISLIPADKNADFAGFRRFLSLLEKSKSVTQSLYLPPPSTLATNFYNGLTVTDTTDPKAFVAAFKESVLAMDNEKTATKDDVKINCTYTPNAVTIDGASVDQYAIRYTSPIESSSKTDTMGTVISMIGGSGQTGYVVIMGNNVITTTTPDTQLIRSAFAALKQEGGLGSTLTGVRSHLPSKSSAEMYIHFGGIATALNPIMSMLRLPSLQLPPADLPPVGIGANLQGSNLGMRVYMPVATLKFIRSNVMSATTGAPADSGPHAAPGGGAQPPPQTPQQQPNLPPEDRPQPAPTAPSNRPGGAGGAPRRP